MAVFWTYPPTQSGFSAAASGPITAAALTIATPQPPPILPPIQAAGTRLRIVAHIECTFTASTATLALGFYLGPVGGAIGSSTLLGITPAVAVAAACTLWPYKLTWEGTFRNLGTAVTMHGCGESFVPSALTLWASAPFPVTAAARTTAATINTTVNQQLDIASTLSSSTGVTGVYVTEMHATLDG